MSRKGYVKGRVIQSSANAPVCLADIHNKNKTSCTRSNSKGEFILGPLEFPASITIRKFGFREETIIINDQSDSLVVTLIPLIIHKSYSGNAKLLRYDMIFKKAIEKLRSADNSDKQDNSRRELVYCRISSKTDSTTNSLFESYARMKTGPGELRDYQASISRYATAGNYTPGLTADKLEFKIDPYIALPIMPERFITRKGFIIIDSSQVAMIRVELDKTINTYYINVSDTSVLYITSMFSSGRKERIPGSQEAWQSDRVSSAEISFSRRPGDPEDYFIDCVSTGDGFRLKSKDKGWHKISRSTIFVVLPDSSMICNAVRDQVSHDALTEMNRQINFRAKYLSSGTYSDLDTETEKLLSKPYRLGFWAGNSLVMPDKNEQEQFALWENNNIFYSEKSRPPEKELISADSLVRVMNNNLVAVENVFLETDRSDYLAGDTIWFSAFVLDNLHMDSTSLSRILYVDLINSENNPEKHLKLLISNGRTYGDFVISKEAKDGIWRLRGYTQYMRNFQDEYLFEKEIQVHQSDFTRLILVNPVIRRSNEGDSVELHFKAILPAEFQSQEKKLAVLARLNDSMSVRKTFAVKKYLDESMGFFVPSLLSCRFVDIRMILSGKELISEQRLSIPLRSGIKLLFFPESGKMVDGIKTVIAFKATDDRGYPAEFEADISDEKNNIIRHISGGDFGVGKFELTPEYNHSYRAQVNLFGNSYSFSLPGVEPEGYILNFDADSSDLVIKNNPGELKGLHYLLLSVRGAVYSAIETRLDLKPLKIHLPLKMYPKGIIQVTLYDSLFRPLAERLVFNNRPDRKIYINVESDKSLYSAREKVTLTLNVSDASGNPLLSSLSLAVVDASRSDTTISSPDIESYLYLSSELKGAIDNSLLNLADTSSDGNRKRDLLMLTQGWRNYLWNSIRYINTYKVHYPIEKGFCINGSVYNLNNSKSRSRYKLSYLNFNSGFNGIADVDENNFFKIDIPFHYGSHDYFIQNKNNKDKIENLGFMLDTFPLPLISWRKNELPFTAYKAGYLKAIERKFSEVDSVSKQDIKYINLPEVLVTAKADRTGYSAPDKSIDLEKKDPTGKKYVSLFQMIYEEFGEKAFSAKGFGTIGKVYYPVLVVNGAPLTVAECPPCYDYISYGWAEAIPVNEISDVKFYEAGSKYSQWLSPPPTNKQTWKTDVMGHGLFILPADPKLYLPIVSFKTYSNFFRGNPKGAILFPYQGLYMAREFYQPDYESKKFQAPDNRTTIYWNPEIETDSTGTARVSFYNSDLKGKGLIRISGVSFELKEASSASASYLSH